MLKPDRVLMVSFLALGVAGALAAPVVYQDVTRELVITNPYLNFPVKNGGEHHHVSVMADGRTVRGFDIELADAKPDWWASLDATPFQGKAVTIKVDRLWADSAGLTAIDQTSEMKDGENSYQESLRPQFHFTARHGWLNDPNGLVFYQGEYHLFFQHNPYGWNGGDKHWGHAVSQDLVHWTELPVALYPDEHGAMYSGSAVVDWHNTAGFQTGKEPALVAMFTAAGNPFTQEIAFSNDRGRTWTKYEHNPVLGHLAADNRDPKVTWFAPENKWVMALYLDHDDYAIFESRDLKNWNKLQNFTLPGDAECPNFFPLPLDGRTNDTRWVFFGASGIYVAGRFDGHQFVPQTQPRRLQNGNCWYAAQVYSDIPAADGRCLLIPWGRLPSDDLFHGLSFNQMLGLPVELTLQSSASGPVLAMKPVRELASLRRRFHDLPVQTLSPAVNPLAGIHGELFEIEAELAVEAAGKITLDLRGVPVVYDVAGRTLSCLGCQTALVPQAGRIPLHIYVDRASVDIWGGEGDLYLPLAHAFSPANQDLTLSCEGGHARIVSGKVYELDSAWNFPVRQK